MNHKIIILNLIIFLSFVLNVSSQVTYTSVSTGNWGNASTWDQPSTPSSTDNVVISSGHLVTVNVNNASITNLTINSSGVLDVGTKGLTIDGNLIVNGTYTGNKNLELTGGAGITVDGTGVIKVNFEFLGNAQILTDAGLSIIASVFLDNDVVVTNNGKIAITEDLRGTNAGSNWINDIYSKLDISDELFPTQGILTASASGNTVIYNSDVNNQNIKTPVGNTYYNIEFTGIKEKRTQDNLYINGNVIINSGIFVSNNNTIYIRGNWSSSSHFEEGSGLVVFDGTSDQTLTRPGGEIFYDCEVDKVSGTFIVSDQLTISNSLTMTSGNINVGNKTITLGTDAGNIGTLFHTSGNVIGKFERWVIASVTAYLFPVGTESDFRPAYPTFASIQTGGTVAFEFIEENPGNAGLSIVDGAVTVYNTFIDGYWDMTEGNGFRLGNTNNFDLDLYGTNFISFAIDADTRLLIRDDAASDWIVDGTHGTNSSPMVQRNGIGTSPAQFCFGDDTNCSPQVTSAMIGNTDVCTGASGEIYSVINNIGNTYLWEIDGGTQVGGTNTNSITVDWGTTGLVGSVTVREHNGCTYGEAVVLDVNLHPIQAAAISGKDNVPQNTLAESYSVIPTVGYTYDWTVSGGTIAGGSGTDNITIDWGVAGTGNVSVISQMVGCADSPPIDLDVNIYIVINSVKTGDWNDATTWDCNCIPDISDNARVVNPHTVTLDANEEIHHFTIDAGATLEMAAKTFKSTGDITIDGTLTSSGLKDITLEATGNIDGTGTISAGNIFILGNKTILSSALLTISSGNMDLNNIYSFMVTNYGNITVANDIIGKSSAAKYWTNGVNSTLNIAGVLLADGQLIAEAEGNTVNYNGTVDQTIKDPDPLTAGYWHLTTSNSGIKTPEANLDVNGDLTINGTTQLDVATGNFNINIAGDWINTSANVDPFLQGNTTETVTFDGVGEQNIINANTETFNNFSIALNSNTLISAGSSVTAIGATEITGILTIKSPNNASGISGSFIDNGTISLISTGKMIAERFINAGQWHEVSSPIKQGTGNNTTAIFTRSISGSFNPNLYIYDETVDLDGDPLTEPAGTFDNNNLVPGWTYAHNGEAGADNNLAENLGYMFYTPLNQTLIFEGEPATGNFDLTGLSFTNNDPDADGDATPDLYDGWHLAGNPYASSIDWDLIRDDQIANLDDGVYVWDNTGYSGYKNGSSVMGGNLTNHIPPMQGFFVRANADNANLEIRNEHRTHGATTYLKSAKNVKSNYLKLKTSANGHEDYIVVQFKEGATNEYDGVYDLVRMFVNPSYGDATLPQLYSITENEGDPLALSVLPLNEMKDKMVPLGLSIGNAGNYTISVDEFNDFNSVHVYLNDIYENKKINLRNVQKYNFHFEGGKIDDRFYLSFEANNAPYVANNISDQQIESGQTYSFKIPVDVFVDVDFKDELTIFTENLPDWLTFNSELRTLEGVTNIAGNNKIEIFAKDLAGATASDVFELTVYSTSDVDDFVFKNVNIYPNPTNDIFILDINKDSFKNNMYFELTDISGKNILNLIISETRTEIDIRNYAKGVYFGKLVYTDNKTAHNSKSFKIIRN